MSKNYNNKVFIKNIYYMLSYAFKGLNLQVYKSLAAEEFDNIHSLLAAILAKGVGYQLKVGLHKQYLTREDNLTLLRGKIDLNRTIKNRVKQDIRICCHFDDLTENNIYNQILKSCLLLLVKSEKVKKQVRILLKKELILFSSIDSIDLRQVKWKQIPYNRHNRSYQFLHAICQIIVEGLLLTTSTGLYYLNDIFDDQLLSSLYEKFLLEYFKVHAIGARVRAANVYWALDEGSRTEMLPKMKTDVTIAYRNEIIIIDAKYYSRTTQVYHGHHSIHSSNLYQIFSYVKNRQLYNKDIPVRGVLLYARTAAEIQPSSEFHMSGNTIQVKTLDLNCDFSFIETQLKEILNDIHSTRVRDKN